ncbi:adenylosuccinate lyase family protein [Pseudooceanicola sp. 216_PA32_1]|uniref:Adenylosuccinate lyase family protein n=1 Tax=Pseudooceanicola pacificus TaxID=2676438 RepID=A0A844W7N6_9RHOB|nr:lyase family protein [Pseudooceanicola pacificus]MWB78794.1 adenylosuccinate lyase family protein [Pseudooceanicola pacificus]
MKVNTPGLTPGTLFARETLWQSWLDVEAALAEVQAEMEMIPAWAAEGIRAAATLDKIGIEALQADIRVTHAPVLSMTRLLGRAAGEAGAYVHWGATTQNVMQTGRILLIRQADGAIRRALGAALDRLAEMAATHAGTLMAGRTNRQHALPITFGFKVAGWIEELTRAVDRLDGGGRRLFVLPFGGAVGAMHAFGPQGQELNTRLAARFGLGALLVPGRAINDLFADYVVQLALMAMTIERIAAELYLLMTEEIGEISETLDPGTVGSSTMPHKINPKFVVRVLAEAAELRGIAGSALETGRSSHEGDAAKNQLLSSVLDRAIPLAWTLAEGFDGLLRRIAVNAPRMERNARLSGGAIATEGLMMLLAPRAGRAVAHDLIHHALDRRAGGSVAEALKADGGLRAHLSEAEIDAALDPANYCGDSARIAQDAARMARELGRQIR